MKFGSTLTHTTLVYEFPIFLSCAYYFQVVFTSHIAGEVTDVYLPCVVEGMDNMIVLGFYANTQVLNVEFTTPGYDGYV